jgi:hypothetical protein
VDVETGFLHVNLQEKISTTVHEGMSVTENSFVLFSEITFSILQSAREVYRRLFDSLKDIGCLENKSDPLFSK